jgi:hypothetical protein
MRVVIFVLAACLGLPGTAAAQDPLTGLVLSFFYYREPPPPIGGDCAAIAAEIGPQLTWYGEFSGKFEQPNDKFRSFAASGCFDSALACRIWQQQAINYAYGAITYTRCRPGVRVVYAR